VLNLVHLDDSNAKEYGEFMHKQGQKIYDFGAYVLLLGSVLVQLQQLQGMRTAARCQRRDRSAHVSRYRSRFLSCMLDVAGASVTAST